MLNNFDDCTPLLTFLYTDTVQKRLHKAKELGADNTLMVASREPKGVAHEIESIMDGSPDIAIDCSGKPSGVQSAVYVGCLYVD